MELEESTFLTSDYTTKLQSSRQHGAGTETKIQTNETRQKAHASMGTLFLTKEARIYNGAKTASSINGYWENWTATCKRMKLEHFLTPYTKINSKWIKDLNVRPETMKLLQENIGRTLYDISQSKILYDPSPRVTEIKTKVNKLNLIKLKSICTAKETINKQGERQLSEWEKIIANEITDKGLISRIQKQHTYNSMPEKKTNNPIKKWEKDLNIYSKKTYR